MYGISGVSKVMRLQGKKKNKNKIKNSNNNDNDTTKDKNKNNNFGRRHFKSCQRTEQSVNEQMVTLIRLHRDGEMNSNE